MYLLKSRLNLILVLSLSSVFGQVTGSELLAETAESVYVNGTVITMDPDDNIAEAIAVEDGKIAQGAIIAAGSGIVALFLICAFWLS
jgi:hypothetical protein